MINNYVDSGVEWLQDIPSHWGVKTIKKLFTESNTKNTDGNTNYLSIVKDKGVVLYSDKGNVGNKTSDHPEKYKMVEVNDIVINPMNIIIGSVGRSKYEGCLSSVYIVLKPNEGTFSNYYEYIFSHKLFQKYLKRICYGIMELRESLNKIEFYVEKLPVPPLQEQQQISDYLDNKTLKIDTLLEKTEQKIELLKEQRTSLINTTVTKGLNPNVEMKDSGVEWIGEIPVGWNIIRLVNLGMFSKGKGIVKDDIKPEGHPCVRGGEVYTRYDRIFNKTVSFISDDTIDKTVLVKYKSILFSGDGETLEEIGKCIVYNGSEDIYIGGGINIFTPIKSVNHIFLSYILNSEYVIFQKSREGRGQIVVHIYQKQLREIRLSMPPLQEQQQIVDYLDFEASKIDKLVDIESKRINLLKEYRQSLISEVVTGKVDVRSEVLV